jgi:hypothetical protein
VVSAVDPHGRNLGFLLYIYVYYFRFLAAGDSYSTIGHSFRVGFTIVRAVVRNVCQAICQRMQGIYARTIYRNMDGISSRVLQNVAIRELYW